MNATKLNSDLALFTKSLLKDQPQWQQKQGHYNDSSAQFIHNTHVLQGSVCGSGKNFIFARAIF